MRTLVIGRGSAGKRHASVLESMGHSVATCSASNIQIGEAEYVVVASLTPDHITCLRKLKEVGYTGKVLVEKPLFMNAAEAEDFPFPVYVGYQLRFHPVAQALRYLLRKERPLSAHIYAGQHISLWGGTYHGDKTRGGGLLRDYSHELDLIALLFGKIVGCDGWLSDDENSYAAAIGTINDVVVSLQLNYLDKPPRREWIVNTDQGSFTADFINNEIAHEFLKESDPTRLMHEDILSNGGFACTYAEGLAINKLIGGIEA